jgi:molecular chaperone DnaJ
MSKKEAEEILGLLPEEYTFHMLRSAYRRALLKFHPDVNKAPNAAEMTRKIVAAYELLKTETMTRALLSMPERGSLIDTYM